MQTSIASSDFSFDCSLFSNNESLLISRITINANTITSQIINTKKSAFFFELIITTPFK